MPHPLLWAAATLGAGAAGQVVAQAVTYEGAGGGEIIAAVITTGGAVAAAVVTTSLSARRVRREESAQQAADRTTISDLRADLEREQRENERLTRELLTRARRRPPAG